MKYLKYWWKASSVVDPEKTTGQYFGVTYDALRRVKTVEKYNEAHQLAGISQYQYRWNRLARAFIYGPKGNLLYSQVYKYGWFGNVTGVEEYNPDGELIRVMDKDR
jgi:hypothetical protein